MGYQAVILQSELSAFQKWGNSTVAVKRDRDFEQGAVLGIREKYSDVIPLEHDGKWVVFIRAMLIRSMHTAIDQGCFFFIRADDFFKAYQPRAGTAAHLQHMFSTQLQGHLDQGLEVGEAREKAITDQRRVEEDSNA